MAKSSEQLPAMRSQLEGEKRSLMPVSIVDIPAKQRRSLCKIL